jgi:hypothetical protein
LWTGIASSADGSKLAAVAEIGQIYTSVNFGTNWTPQGAVGNWGAVVSSADGNDLVAAAFNVSGTGGHLATSVDGGQTWANHGTNLYWAAVASSADGTKILAAVLGGQLYVSTDSGSTLTATASTDRWSCVACSTDGAKLIAATDYNPGTGKIYVSPPLPPPSPALAVFLTRTNTAVVFWPSSATAWSLQQNTNLSAGSWNVPPETIQDDGTNKFIVATPPLDKRFFRLSNP